MTMTTTRNPFRKTSSAVAAMLVLSGGAITMQPALGASCTWNPGSGNWATSGNWSCGAVPTGPNQDNAAIGAGKTVTINTAQSIYGLTNGGTIAIDASTLTLQSGGSTVNTGTINVGNASTAATLQDNNNIANSGGTINLSAGSTLNQGGTTITGGTIAGPGTLVASNSGDNFLTGVTLNGTTLDLATNVGSERVTGGLTLNGAVNINNNSILSFEGTQALGGTGTITLGASGSGNRIAIDGGGTLTVGSGILIHGQNGTIGSQPYVGSVTQFVNNGTIAADVAGGTITIAVNTGATNGIANSITNNGVLEAINGGTLVLNNSVTSGAGSSIAVGAGSTVLQNGVTLSGVINNTGGSFVASNNGNNFLNGVAFNGALDLATNVGVERVVNGLTLNGAVNVNSNSILNFEGTQALVGTGTITLGDSGSGNRIGIDGGATLTVGSGILIHGQNGTIGGQPYLGGASQLVNNGTIAADVAGGTITLATTSAAANSIINNGLLEAINGGRLVLNSNVTGGVGSSITVGAGSSVLQNGVTLSSVINNTGGSFVASNSGNNFLNGVVFNGTLDLATNVSVERVVNGLTLNGAVNVNSNSILNFEGTQALGGTGTITLGDSGSGNRIGIDGGATLTVGSGILIHGQNGTIGGQPYLTGASQLVNNGTIAADVAGGTITLATTSAAANSIINNGVLEAINGGTLVLNSNVTGGAGSSIIASSQGKVLQNGVTLSGVTLINNFSSSGSYGNFVASNSGNNYLNGVTINGALDLATNMGVERVTNGLTLNGYVSIDNNSILNFEGVQSLTGTGRIFLGAAGSGNRIGIDNNGTLNVGAEIQIAGQNGTIGGQPYFSGASTLNNAGQIAAEFPGSLALVATQTNNSGQLAAVDGGQLVLSGAVTNLANGHIDAISAGSNVLQNGVTITGGTLNSSQGGVFVATNNGNNVLSGVTLNGTLDAATNVSVERVVGGMTLNGAINVDSNSILNFEGVQSLAGSGTITLGSSGSGNRIGIDNTGTLNIGAGITVQGQNGTIGGQPLFSGASTLNNAGTISANVAKGLITIAANNVTNSGTLAAQGGTLTVNPTITGSGTLRVDSGGVLNLANGGNTQGQLAMGSAGSINIGTGNLTITGDYTNAQSGTGNAFNRSAGVTGGGLVVAGGNAAQAITGVGVTGGATGNATLTLGNMHVGTTTYDYQIANTGTSGPTLRGAIQTNVNGASLTDARLGGSGVSAGNYSTGAPGSNSGNLAVAFTAANAGVLAPLSGQSVNLTSNFANIADQKLNIVLGSGAAAYNLAAGSATTPVQVANQRVGGSGSATLAIANTAAAGSYSEDLNASVGTASGSASATGSVNGRLAGTGNTGTGAITVGVDTTSAGAKSGSVGVNYVSTGAVNGVSNGLGTTAIGGQTITVTGNVYQAAAGALQTAPLNFGTVQVGQSVSQNLVVRNTATGASGFVEDLNASFGGTSGTGASAISGSGSLSGILAGSNSTAANGAMTVTVNTSSAGVINGGIAVNYTTAGAVNGVSNGLGTASVGSQTYGVAGSIQAVANVINQASPLVNNAVIDLGSHRLGDSAPTANVSVTNVATATPQAALTAGITNNTAAVTAGGSFNLLAPGKTSTTDLTVGLSTATAGNFTGSNAGSATLSFISDASNVGGCGSNCQLSLASQQVTVSGKVYSAAGAQLNTTAVDFGIVHVGDSVATKGVLVTNSGATSNLSDVLTGSFSGATGPFTATGSLTGVGAQASNATSFQAGLSTATSGVFSGTATAAFQSHDGDLADLALGSSQVSLTGRVNNYAVAAIGNGSGGASLSHSGNTYTLDFGTLLLGGADVTDSLFVLNDAAGIADLLAGNFSVSSGSGFSLTGFSGFSQLGAGQQKGGYDVTFSGASEGSFLETLLLQSTGSNSGGYSAGLGDITLVLEGNVSAAAAVPEPGNLALLLAGLAGLFGIKHLRHRAARRAA